MAYVLPAATTLPTDGIDFTQTYAVSVLTPEYPGLPFPAGMRALALNGAEYVFVTASSIITANQAVGIEQSTNTAAPLTKAMADAGREIAAAPVAIASGSSGWVQTKGAASITLKNSCLPNVPLYTTASAGMLDDTSDSQTRVYGIRSTDTATASGAAKLCWIQQAVT